MKEFNSLPKNMQTEKVKEYYDILSSKKATLFVKRLLDFVVSLIVFVLLIPFNIVFALLVKLTSKGPVFFKQKRVGRYGREFNVLKFRTMVVNAESIGTQITVGKDPRITSVGGFLRKFRIDEFPQIVNVLKGDMSIVGTRPEVKRYVDCYTDEMFATLLLAPGITGAASIYFKNEAEILQNKADPEKSYVEEILPKKMQINLDYMKIMSINNDFKLILKTFTEVAKG